MPDSSCRHYTNPWSKFGLTAFLQLMSNTRQGASLNELKEDKFLQDAIASVFHS